MGIDESVFYVAQEGDCLIGFNHAYRLTHTDFETFEEYEQGLNENLNSNGDYLFALVTFVLPEFRLQGAGKALFRKNVEFSSNQGISCVRFVCDYTNLAQKEEGISLFEYYGQVHGASVVRQMPSWLYLPQDKMRYMMEIDVGKVDNE